MEGPAERQPSLLTRRTVIGAAAWSVPVIALGTASPAYAWNGGTPTTTPTFATSGHIMTGYPWSSWGVTWGSQKCKVSTGGGTKNTYSWDIDNTSSSRLPYNGVRFYAKKKTDLYGTYSNLINVYFLPFSTGTVDPHGSQTQGWSTLAYDASYGTLTGPDSAIYYAWVTKYSGSYVVNSDSQICSASQRVSFGGDQYYWMHVPNDYRFTVTGSTTAALPKMWASHQYYAEIDGAKVVNSTSVNGNYTGASGNYPSTTGDESTGWRNNGWVKIPLDSWSDDSCDAIGGGGNTCAAPYNACIDYRDGAVVSYQGHNFKWHSGSRYRQGYWEDLGSCTGSSGDGGTSSGTDRGTWTSGTKYNYCDVVTYNDQKWQCNYYWCQDVRPGGKDDTGIWTCLGDAKHGFRSAGAAFAADAVETTTSTADPTTTTSAADPTTTGSTDPTTTTGAADPTTTTDSPAVTTTMDTTDVADADLTPTFEQYATPTPIVDTSVDGAGLMANKGSFGIQGFSMAAETDTSSTGGADDAVPAPC